MTNLHHRLRVLEARRTLAQSKLEADESKAWLRYCSDEHLARMEELLTQYAGVPDDQQPLEVRDEFKAILRATARAMREADVPGRDMNETELMALSRRLEESAATEVAGSSR